MGGGPTRRSRPMLTEMYTVAPLLASVLLLLMAGPRVAASSAGVTAAQAVPFARSGDSKSAANGKPALTPRELHCAVWGPGWDDRTGGGGGGSAGGGSGSGGGGVGGCSQNGQRDGLWRRHRGGLFARGEGRWRHATLALAKYVEVHRGIVASAAAASAASHRARAFAGGGA